MKKQYYLVYIPMFVAYFMPFIPMSIKGIFGFVLILWSCVMVGLRTALITAATCIILGTAGEILYNGVTSPQTVISIITGSVAYFLVAFYFGRYSQSLKQKNAELTEEINRRERAEKELSHKLGQLRGLMDTIPNPIYFTDLNGTYLDCNKAFTEMTRIREEELIGRSVNEFGDSILHVCSTMDANRITGDGLQHMEESVTLPDGRHRCIVVSKALFLDKNHTPAGVVGVLTDITEQKETVDLKQSIAESRQKMEEILENEKLKTEFLSNISHEFRTPLNVILGTLQLMELYMAADQYAASREKIINRTAILKQNSYRLMRLVNNLIDITRIDAKAYEMHYRNCDIITLLRDITLSVAEYTENEGIHVTFESDTQSRRMVCDDEKMERILLNLLSNAVKFTPKGGEIAVRLFSKPDGLCIQVEDNGRGIPADKQNRIFQRFCQIDGIFTRQHEGSGIGLSLVKSLVEMHGGTITFTSEPDKGTSFFLFLPQIDVDESALNYTFVEKQTHAHSDRVSVEFSDIYHLDRK